MVDEGQRQWGGRNWGNALVADNMIHNNQQRKLLRVNLVGGVAGEDWELILERIE